MNVVLVGIHLVALCRNGFAASLTQPALIQTEAWSFATEPILGDSVVQFNKMHATARLRYTATRSKSHWSTEDELANKLNELERHFAGENGTEAITNDPHDGHAVHQGGDRMNPKSHNYGHTYAKYLAELGDSFMKQLQAQPTNPQHPEDMRLPQKQQETHIKPGTRNHPVYAKYLTKLASIEGLSPTIVEVGILTGTGLAMWNSLFPNARIHGFDIDTSPYLNNVAALKKLGFNDASTQVQVLDEQSKKHNGYNAGVISKNLGGAKANIVVDDGDHDHTSAARLFRSMFNSLADNFVYFIEDVDYADSPGMMEYIDALKNKDEGFLEECRNCELEEIPDLGSNGDEHSHQGMIVISRFK